MQVGSQVSHRRAPTPFRGRLLAVIVVVILVAGVALAARTVAAPTGTRRHVATHRVKRGSGLANPPTFLSATATRGWSTLFQDNFVSDARLGDEWHIYSGPNIGISTFRTSEVAIGGDRGLVLSADRRGGRWYGGFIYSHPSFFPAPGHTLLIESRLSLPSGQGLWPAFWMLADSARNLATGVPDTSKGQPAAGELDIAETIDTKPWVDQLVHCGLSKYTGPCGDNLAGGAMYLPGGSQKTSMNTYSVLWRNAGPESFVAFYIDSRLQFVKTMSELGRHYWYEAFGHPYFLLYDMAVGGYAGKIDTHTPSHASLVVDWVRVLSTGR